ncbi:hypothetical protein COBT_004164, partial [Conglomerata obtusa]
NQTLFIKLQKLCDFGKYDWKKFLHLATNAYNISYHAALRTSPLLYRFGTCPNFPIDGNFGKLDINLNIQELKNLREINFPTYAQKYIQKGKKQDKRRFKEGDRILVYNEKGRKKIQSNWQTGYIIKSCIHENSFLVEKDGSILR